MVSFHCQFTKSENQLIMIIIPKNYSSPYGIMDTERAIKLIKDTFEKALAEALHLTRISAPLFVDRKSTRLNSSHW